MSSTATLPFASTTLPATSAPVQSVGPANDNKMQPFYKKKHFIYMVAAVAVAVLLYWWWKSRATVTLATVGTAAQLVGGGSCAMVSVPVVETDFDVGGGYDAPDYAL